MNRMFGTKKAPAPEVKAPSLTETSGVVLVFSQAFTLDRIQMQSLRGKSERLQQGAEQAEGVNENAERSRISE